MAGTAIGAAKAAATNKLKHGENFYRDIGRRGGKNGRSGGFAQGEAGKLRAQKAGSIGGKISRRGPGVKYEYKGTMLSIVEIAKALGVTPNTIRLRLSRYGSIYGAEQAE